MGKQFVLLAEGPLLLAKLAMEIPDLSLQALGPHLIVGALLPCGIELRIRLVQRSLSGIELLCEITAFLSQPLLLDLIILESMFQSGLGVLHSIQGCRLLFNLPPKVGNSLVTIEELPSQDFPVVAGIAYLLFEQAHSRVRGAVRCPNNFLASMQAKLIGVNAQRDRQQDGCSKRHPYVIPIHLYAAVAISTREDEPFRLLCRI